MSRGVLGRLRREELGATSVVVVLLMTVLLACAALVVDVGAVQARKAQLQDAADAAALALAEECFRQGGTSPLGCAGSVTGRAAATALELALANVPDQAVAVDAIVWTSDTVRVELRSPQTGYFGRFFDRDETDVLAAATARWEQPIVPLSLAMASCAFPAPGQPTVLQSGLAIPAVLSATIGDDCGLLDTESTYDQLAINPVTGLLATALRTLLPAIPDLNGTTGLVAGGWLTTSTPLLGVTPDDCSYDPNLLTTVTATVSKAIPTSCAAAVRGWGLSTSDPQRVLLPVFDNGLDQLVNDDVLATGAVDRFAVVDVTGYSFSGLLGLGTVAGSSPALCTSTNGALGDALLDTVNGVTGSLATWLALTQGGATALLGTITGCQALAGTFVGFVDAPEAAELLTGVQLVG